MDCFSLNINYTVLFFGSCIIATLGLRFHSGAVVIGAMIIAPLMLSIRGLAFAENTVDWFTKGRVTAIAYIAILLQG